MNTTTITIGDKEFKINETPLNKKDYHKKQSELKILLCDLENDKGNEDIINEIKKYESILYFNTEYHLNEERYLFYNDIPLYINITSFYEDYLRIGTEWNTKKVKTFNSILSSAEHYTEEEIYEEAIDRGLNPYEAITCKYYRNLYLLHTFLDMFIFDNRTMFITPLGEKRKPCVYETDENFEVTDTDYKSMLIPLIFERKGMLEIPEEKKNSTFKYYSDIVIF